MKQNKMKEKNTRSGKDIGSITDNFLEYDKLSTYNINASACVEFLSDQSVDYISHPSLNTSLCVFYLALPHQLVIP